MDLGLKGKRALIVGASKNIGAAVARCFAAEECAVTVVARDQERLAKLVDELGGTAAGHGFVCSDLLEHGEPTRVAVHIRETIGHCEIVVHNVGGALGCKDPFGRIEDWERVWRFNVGVAIEMNRVLIPAMLERGWGRVVHVSSISAQDGEPLSVPYGGAIPYAAAKAYLNAYVKALGRECAKGNVIVSALMPGAILSEGKYWDTVRQEQPALVNDFVSRHYAIGRFGRPEEIAPFAVFMASEQASFAAGAIVPIDGGRM